MPWQSAPALVIIGGAFAVVGGLMQALNYIDHGTRDRKLRIDPFDKRMMDRDMRIKAAHQAEVNAALEKVKAEQKRAKMAEKLKEWEAKRKK